jgi:hypothetical protein
MYTDPAAAVFALCCIALCCTACLQALHAHTMKLLSQALRLFPTISVKLSAFLERLLVVRTGFCAAEHDRGLGSRRRGSRVSRVNLQTDRALFLAVLTWTPCFGQC